VEERPHTQRAETPSVHTLTKVHTKLLTTKQKGDTPRNTAPERNFVMRLKKAAGKKQATPAKK